MKGLALGVRPFAFDGETPMKNILFLCTLLSFTASAGERYFGLHLVHPDPRIALKAKGREVPGYFDLKLSLKGMEFDCYVQQKPVLTSKHVESVSLKLTKIPTFTKEQLAAYKQKNPDFKISPEMEKRLTTPQDPIASIVIKLKASAVAAFAAVTTEHQGRNLAVVVDSRVINLVQISKPITDGTITVNGFSEAAARDIVSDLQSLLKGK